jgi:hypothetical protein
VGDVTLNTRIEVVGASRPFPGQTANGDDWVRWDATYGPRVAVIDGLGHGPPAADAARQLRRLLLEAPEGGLAEVVGHAARRMLGGRGAVATLVEVRGRELTFIGVGNVEGRLVQRGREQRLLGARGFFGGPVRSARPQVTELDAGWVLYLYTDGVSSRFPLPADGAVCDAQEAVDRIVEGHGRMTDDATVVMVREA